MTSKEKTKSMDVLCILALIVLFYVLPVFVAGWIWLSVAAFFTWVVAICAMVVYFVHRLIEGAL